MNFKNYIKEKTNLIDSCLEEVIATFQKSEIKKKDFILEVGQINNKLIFVESGIFRIFHITPEGKEATACFFHEGQFAFDIISYVKNIPSKEYIQCLEDSIIYSIQKSELEALYKKEQQIERLIRIMIEDQFVYFKEVLLSQLRESAEERYLKILNERPYLINRVPMKHISSYLGINEPSLSRIRKRIVKY